MEVVVTGRHCELSERFRDHVTEKLSRLEKHDHRIIRVQVEVENERNPRQHDRAVKVELTAFSKGPVIRAEASAEDKVSALDQAVDKMASQMRRAALLPNDTVGFEPDFTSVAACIERALSSIACFRQRGSRAVRSVKRARCRATPPPCAC